MVGIFSSEANDSNYMAGTTFTQQVEISLLLPLAIFEEGGRDSRYLGRQKYQVGRNIFAMEGRI